MLILRGIAFATTEECFLNLVPQLALFQPADMSESPKNGTRRVTAANQAVPRFTQSSLKFERRVAILRSVDGAWQGRSIYEVFGS